MNFHFCGRSQQDHGRTLRFYGITRSDRGTTKWSLNEDRVFLIKDAMFCSCFCEVPHFSPKMSLHLYAWNLYFFQDLRVFRWILDRVLPWWLRFCLTFQWLSIIGERVLRLFNNIFKRKQKVTRQFSRLIIICQHQLYKLLLLWICAWRYLIYRISLLKIRKKDCA